MSAEPVKHRMHAEPPGLMGLLAHRSGDAADGGARVVEALAHNLRAGRKLADIGQCLAAGVVVFVLWPQVPGEALLTWYVVWIACLVARVVYRSHLVSRLTDPEMILTAVRWDVWISSACWGALPFVVAGGSDLAMALVLVAFAGLAAAGTSTLVADRKAWVGFAVGMQAPLAIAIAMGGFNRVNVSFLVLIALFLPFMVSVNQRAHATVVDQLRANSDLRESEAEATRRGAFLDALFAHTPAVVAVLDEHGRLLHGNPAFEVIVGASVDALRGRSVTELLGDDVSESRVRAFLDALRQNGGSDAEIKITAADGDPIWLKVSGTTAAGDAAGLSIVSGVDVTAQVELRDALEIARRDAVAIARAKSSFLASMSHEIRTPMNGMLGMISLLLDTPLTDEQRQSIQVVQSSADALLRILNDILDVSKIEAGQLDLEEIDFDLPRLVNETAQVFTPQTWSKEIELVVELAAFERPWMLGDPVRLRQVLSNLLSNAVKFTEEGEVVLSVAPVPDSERPPGPVPWVRFRVQDTGIGIPREKHSAIFNEFEQADQSTTRTHGGTGLGLAIARRLVEIMGGRLQVESIPGRGSTFSFQIPLALAERRKREPDPTPALKRGQFLVVDDNDTARRSVRDVLVTQGAAVDEAAGVEIALRLAQDSIERGQPYHAAIVDRHMPRRDGFDLARGLAMIQPDRRIPIIMLSSSAEPNDEVEARSLGIAAYLPKPVAGPELLRAIADVRDHGTVDGPERRLVTETTLAGPRPLRILVAEDNTVNQHVMRATLTKRGHHVDIVGNGKLAVEAVLAESYDIVLMDIQMPVMDGHEATRRIREHRAFDSLPIVAVTAHAFVEQREKCAASGMNGFLAKPIKPSELFEAIQEWVPEAPQERVAAPAPRAVDGPAPEEASLPDAPVDVGAFRAMMRDAEIEHIVEPTLDLYGRETPVIFERIRAAVESRDCGEVSSTAHLLKSSSANIRADTFAELLLRLEHAGAADDISEVDALMPDVESEYQAVIEYLASVSGSLERVS